MSTRSLRASRWMVAAMASTCLLFPGTGSAAEADKPGLVLMLELLEDGAPGPQGIVVRLTLENRGPRSRRVVLPPSTRQFTQAGGWFGYRFRIDGPGGAYCHIPLPKPLPPLRPDQTTLLGPGRSVGVLLDIGGTIPERAGTYRARPLRETPGPCTVTVSYLPTKSLLAGHDGQTDATGPLWEGEAHAKPLKLTIAKRSALLSRTSGPSRVRLMEAQSTNVGWASCRSGERGASRACLRGDVLGWLPSENGQGCGWDRKAAGCANMQEPSPKKLDEGRRQLTGAGFRGRDSGSPERTRSPASE